MTQPSLGSPRGRLVIDTSDVTRARTVVISAAGDMSRSFAVSGAQIQGTIQAAAQSLQKLSLMAGLATTGGIAAAQSNRQLAASYAAILGSAERATSTLAEIRQLSDEFKLPFLGAAQGARGLLTLLNTTNLSMRELLLTSQQLALLNPAEGAAGASFSLREYLSGDITSIVERFNLSRQALNQIKAQANGDQAEMLRLLNEFLDRSGITTEALRDMGESGAFAFQRVGSAIQEAAATAFTPLLENVVLPLAEGFANFLNELRETNAPLLQTGSIFVLAAAGAAPLLLALNQAITAYRTLRAVAATPLGTTTGRIVLTIASVEIGAQIGFAISRFLAQNGIGDPRLATEDPGSVFNERLRQLAVIYADALMGVVGVIQQARIMLDNAWNIIISSIAEGALWIQIAFLDLYKAVLQVTGQDTSAVERQRDFLYEAIAILRNSRPEGVGLSEAQQQAYDQAFQSVRQSLILGIFNSLFPSVEAGAEAAGEGIETGGATLLDKMMEIANSPEWQDLLDAIAENAEKIKQENDERMIAAGREGEDFARGRMRTIADERRQNERIERQQIERERQKIAEIEAIGTEAAQREADVLKKDLADRERDLKEHNKRLLEIQRSGHFAILDAIADGDGVAAIRAVRSAQEQTRKENEQYDERKKQRDEDLKEQREAIADQRDERIRAAVQQLADMQAEFAQQRAEREADFNERLAREDEDRSIRLSREQEDFERRRALQLAADERRIGAMQTQIFVEAGLFQSFQSSLSMIFQNIRNEGIRFLSELWSFARGLDGRGMIGGGAGTRAIPIAATGALLTSDGLIFGHKDEVILNPHQQQQWNNHETYVSVYASITAAPGTDLEAVGDEFVEVVAGKLADRLEMIRA